MCLPVMWTVLLHCMLEPEPSDHFLLLSSDKRGLPPPRPQNGEFRVSRTKTNHTVISKINATTKLHSSHRKTLLAD